MGILCEVVDRSHVQQKKGIVEECEQAGAHIVDVLEPTSVEGCAAAAAGESTLEALFGGRMSGNVLQVFLLRSGDLEHLYVQPYDGLVPVPGEHHAALPGGLPAPAILRTSILGKTWRTEDDRETARALARAPELKRACRRLRWHWAAGTETIRLGWTVQLGARGDGTTHVVMQPGRHGRLTTSQVGVRAFLGICAALRPLLAADAVPAQELLAPTAFTPLFDQFVAPPVAGAASRAAGGA